MTNETLGHFGRSLERCEYLTLSFSPFNVPLRSRWRNNGVSADFLGDYVVTFLPSNGSGGANNNRVEIKHAVTYIANELLENAMKYRERDVDLPIGIHLELSSEHITVSATNGAALDQAERYKTFVEHILDKDASELLIEQLEDSAEEGKNKSCLGLLTMINDYQARLGWRFEVNAAHSETMNVTTSVVLSVQNLPEVSA